MMHLFIAIFSSYVVTCVITSSSLFEPLRKLLINKTPKLKIGIYKHPIECRLCLGFWVSILVSLVFADIEQVLAIYGASYFLATLEK